MKRLIVVVFISALLSACAGHTLSTDRIRSETPSLDRILSESPIFKRTEVKHVK